MGKFWKLMMVFLFFLIRNIYLFKKKKLHIYIYIYFYWEKNKLKKNRLNLIQKQINRRLWKRIKKTRKISNGITKWIIRRRRIKIKA